MIDSSTNSLHDGGTELDYGYLNALIREVIVNGDSLDKYRLMLKKRFPEKDIFLHCQDFVQECSRLKEGGSPTFSVMYRLQKKGGELHLSEETMNDIFRALDGVIINSPEKKEGKSFTNLTNIDDLYDYLTKGGRDVGFASSSTRQLKKTSRSIVCFYILSIVLWLVFIFYQAFFLDPYGDYYYDYSVSVALNSDKWFLSGLCLSALLDFLSRWKSLNRGDLAISLTGGLFYLFVIAFVFLSFRFLLFWYRAGMYDLLLSGMLAAFPFFVASALRLFIQRRKTKLFGLLKSDS
jgi:hypothetical protein